MKKKILFGLGAVALAAVLSLNVTLAKNGQNGEIALTSIGKATEAQAEYNTGCMACWSGGVCYLGYQFYFGYDCQ